MPNDRVWAGEVQWFTHAVFEPNDGVKPTVDRLRQGLDRHLPGSSALT